MKLALLHNGIVLALRNAQSQYLKCSEVPFGGISPHLTSHLKYLQKNEASTLDFSNEADYLNKQMRRICENSGCGDIQAEIFSHFPRSNTFLKLTRHCLFLTGIRMGNPMCNLSQHQLECEENGYPLFAHSFKLNF